MNMKQYFQSGSLKNISISSIFCLLTYITVNAQKRPNILFILTDDLGKEWVSTYGARDVETPNIDYLAKTGLVFNNFYSMPQCTPSRICMLTGQYPFRNGWINHWDVPRWGGGAFFDWEKNPDLGVLMKSLGYKTVAAGKWQVNDFRVQPDAMTHHGFDDYCMWTGYEEGNPASAERYWDPYIHTKTGSKTYKGKFGEDIFSDFLINFMRENKEEPMFIYYPLCLTHRPFTSTPAEPFVTGALESHKAMVRYMDFIVGKMIQALDNLEIRDNTIIVYTTDNGTDGSIVGNLNGREVRGGKLKTTENGICEPFIVNCPGIVPQRVSNALADLTDIVPTFTDLAGGKLPDSFVFDGTSLKDVILGKTLDSRREWIMAMGGNDYSSEAQLSEKGLENEYIFRDRVIRNKRFKLYLSSRKEPVKLVDVISDPEEKFNLINDPSPFIKDALKSLVRVGKSFPDRDGDPLYSPLPKEPWDKPVSVKSQVWKKR